MILSLSESFAAFPFRFGALKKKMMKTTVTDSMIGLIQKHHLHVSLSVKTPPSSGPATDAIPNMPVVM